MKFAVIASNILMLIANCLVCFFVSKPPVINNHISTLPVAPISSDVVPAAIATFNARCDKYSSFACETIEMTVWQKRLKLHLDAQLYYEKPRNSRFLVKSALGKEADIGTNDVLFWIWAKRMKQGLLYANHADFERTGMPIEHNPLLFQKSFGFDRIDTLQSKIFEKNGSYLVVSKVDAKTTKMASINSQGFLEGFVLADLDGQTLLSAEIRRYEGDCPAELLFNWPKDQVNIQMEIKKPQLNVALDKQLWQMPQITPQVKLVK